MKRLAGLESYGVGVLFTADTMPAPTIPPISASNMPIWHLSVSFDVRAPIIAHTPKASILPERDDRIDPSCA